MVEALGTPTAAQPGQIFVPFDLYVAENV